MGKTRSSVC